MVRKIEPVSIELEQIFSPDVLAALDERIRLIAMDQAYVASSTEWLDVPRAAEYISSTEYHIREIIARLKAEGSDDVYQPNGPGRKPLLVRRLCLRNLTKISVKR